MKPVSVSQINEYIAKKLGDDYNLKNIAVEGEISGLSKSGYHYYFTLKDQSSQIRCAIWGSNANKVDMSLVENGNKIIAICSISPYAKGGTYSLSITHVEKSGEGDLMAEFIRIKNLLEGEGLFDAQHKKAIPEFPYRVAVVTSASGAAIEDIRKIITSKNDFTDILIFPTQVQGSGACKSIIDNIEAANKLADEGYRIDTIIVGRGGGSPEDLAAFNDEGVCRAIFASKIPIISAVGHENDYSISDMVADKRAETPTAAADMAVMDTFELKKSINESKSILCNTIARKIETSYELLDSKTDLIIANIKSKISDAASSIEKAMIILKESDPRRVFSKGYAAVIDSSGAIISSVDNIVEKQNYIIKMKDGCFNADVKDIRKDEIK